MCALVGTRTVSVPGDRGGRSAPHDGRYGALTIRAASQHRALLYRQSDGTLLAPTTQPVARR
jgi:hypothetical protein